MTKGQIEAKICELAAKFEVEFLGRGPKNIKTMIIEDLIIIRQNGFLTQAEQKLAEEKKGIEIVKQARVMLFEKYQDYFRESIRELITIEIVSVHSDVSTKTGEKVIILSLSENLEKKLEDNGRPIKKEEA
ncbi:MAG: DUF2294 domain-containing protein [Clostridium sp.]